MLARPLFFYSQPPALALALALALAATAQDLWAEAEGLLDTVAVAVPIASA